MAKGSYFEDLEMWKEGMQVCVRVYELLKDCKDFGFRDQIQRAAVSIPSNIAEGYERQTDKEFIHFLFIAKGSCGELRTQLYLAKELKYIQLEEFKALFEKTKRLSAMINNFIQARKSFPPLTPSPLNPLTP